MKLGVSHLAWDIEESEEIFKFLRFNGINNIEGVLTKIDDWNNLSENTIHSYKNLLNSKSINITSLQSLFYKTNINDLNDEEIFINHIKRLIKYGQILSINTLVFGSPSLRKMTIATKNKINYIFKEIDLLLQNTGIELSIEPNSKIYKGDFFYTLSEIIEFIEENKFKNIKTMIDTHNLILEKQSPINDLQNYFKYINHIHVSENSLEPLSNFEFHFKFAEKIRYSKYNKHVIYEVKKSLNTKESINTFINIYK